MSQIKAGTCRACGRNLVQVVGERVYHPASVDLVSAPCPVLIPMSAGPGLSSDVPEDQFVPIGHVVSDARKRAAEKQEMAEEPSDCCAHVGPLRQKLADACAERDRLAAQLADRVDEVVRHRVEIGALRVAVIELATKHGIPSDELYAVIGGQS